MVEKVGAGWGRIPDSARLKAGLERRGFGVDRGL